MLISLLSKFCRYLTEVKFQKPVIVYNYPKQIKAFYMRVNDDGKTVAAMDVLVPKVGCFSVHFYRASCTGFDHLSSIIM